MKPWEGCQVSRGHKGSKGYIKGQKTSISTPPRTKHPRILGSSCWPSFCPTTWQWFAMCNSRCRPMLGGFYHDYWLWDSTRLLRGILGGRSSHAKPGKVPRGVGFLGPRLPLLGLNYIYYIYLYLCFAYTMCVVWVQCGHVCRPFDSLLGTCFWGETTGF